MRFATRPIGGSHTAGGGCNPITPLLTVGPFNGCTEAVDQAAKHGDGYVVADNDKSGTGERVAKQIGMPYWISGLAGEDFNDFHKRLRLFGASQELRKFLSNSTRKA